MKFVVVGVEKTQGTSKQTGQPYSGTRLHLLSQSSNVVGFSCTSFYVSDRIGVPAGVAPDCKVDICFNQFGKIDSVELLEK